MTCKRSKQCDNADICQFAQSDDYNLLGGSCFTPKDPQTNEEWLKHCNTEQLAEWLNHNSDFCEICENHCDNDTGMQCNGDFKERWVEWLKQPHT